MKKIVFVLIALFLTLSLVSPALAAPGNKVAKGEVTSINADGTITILTLRQQSIIVVPPAGYDLASLQIGDIVLVKGRYDSEGRLAAEWLKIPDDGWGEDANEDDDDGGKPENPGKGNDKDKNKDKDKSDDEADDDDEKAFCESGGIHPVAARLAERYGVTTDWVMSYYCNGYGMGQIMLALKTSSLTDADPESLLAETAEGTGWGEIWQAMKLIGKDRDAKSPPGQLKKLNP